MHAYTDSKVALRNAVTKPSKRLSCWELMDEVNKDSALKAELDRQRAKAQKLQQANVCKSQRFLCTGTHALWMREVAEDSLRHPERTRATGTVAQ
jgi:hypothetical protein